MGQSLRDFLVLGGYPCTLSHFVLSYSFSAPRRPDFKLVIHTILMFPVSSTSETDSRMELIVLWPRLPSKAVPCVETMPDMPLWLQVVPTL